MSFWAVSAACVVALALASGCKTEAAAKAAPLVKPTLLTSYKTAKEQSVKLKKPLFMKFTATWCGPCKEMEEGFSDPRISPQFENMVAVELDIDKPENKELVEKYHPEGGIPYVLILRPDGSRISDQLGYESVAQFESFLKESLAKS